MSTITFGNYYQNVVKDKDVKKQVLKLIKKDIAKDPDKNWYDLELDGKSYRYKKYDSPVDLTAKVAGKTYNIGDFCLFEKSPIEWNVVKDDGDTITLVSTKLLYSMEFALDEYDKYAESLVREFLNVRFLNESFSDEEKAKLIKQNIMKERSLHSGFEHRKDVAKSIDDYVYILSKKEARSEDYGMKLKANRKFAVTEYASFNGGGKAGKNGNWWTRTTVKGVTNDFAHIVTNKGSIDKADTFIYGVCLLPCIVIKK